MINCSYISIAQECSHFKVYAHTYAFDDFNSINLWPSQRHKGIKNVVQYLLSDNETKLKSATKASRIKPL